MGMISVQVPTSLCMQNKLIIHSCYCFVEQYVYVREPNIYMGNLYLCARFRIEWSGFGAWPGTLRRVLGQHTLLSRCLSPPRCIIGYRRNAGGNPAMD